uniref:BED-type domain-containing protein n=1 Tax=Panagrolaimus sp. JU765 TaxID=591449 RepID=A0AC34QER4_9BILA
MSKQLRKYSPRYRDGNPIWRYFEVSDAVIGALPICTTCGSMIMNGWKSIAGNTTNMRQHLRNKHPGLFDELVELCQQQKNRYNPENWAIVPYVPKEEIFENILLRSGSVNDDEVDADEDCDLDPSPLQADSTPSASVSNNELSTFEPEAARNDVLPSKSFQEEEAALRLELLRNQIRREKAMAEFYEIQTKEIQQRLVSNLQRPASQF